MKKVLSIFCIIAVMMLQVSCNNSSSEEQGQVEDISNDVTSEEISQEDENVIDDDIQSIEEDAVIDDNNIELSEIIDSGSCGAEGDNVTFTLYNDSTLVIEGTGAMANYDFVQSNIENYEWDNASPYYQYKDNITSIIIKDGVTTIGKNAFAGQSKVTKVEMSDTITTIENGAFYFCYSLTDIKLSKNITYLGTSAFNWCQSLTSIEIPTNIDTIKMDTYNYCKNITSVIIPNNITSIGMTAFAYCENLNSVIIPNSVTTIEMLAFTNCSENLTIQGESGSYAEQYANENGINFEAITFE